LAVPIVPAGAGPYRKDQCRDAATAALTCGDRRVRRCSTSAGPPGTASARGAHGRPGTAHVLRTGDTPATTSRQRTPSRTPAFSSRSGQSVPASWRDSPSPPARRVGDMRELQLISYNLFATACYCHPSCRSMLIRALASHARNSAWGSLTDCSVPVHYVTVGAFVGSGTEPGPSETPGASRANSVRQSPPTASVAGPAAVNGPSTTSTALPRPTRRSARSGR